MRKLSIIITISCLLFGMAACGGYNQGITQADNHCYIKFTGNLKNLSVTIDDGVPFTIDTKGKTIYEITPGKHLIVVKRGDETIVKREILIGNGMTKEINLK